MDDSQQVNLDAVYPLLLQLARKEVAQKMKNLRRELDNANARCAKLSQRIGRYRQTNRELRAALAVKQIIQEQSATKAERRGHTASA